MAVRVVSSSRNSAPDLQARLADLPSLPLRPTTSRILMDAFLSQDLEGELPAGEELDRRASAVCEIDPGWVLSQVRTGRSTDWLTVVAETPWWPAMTSSAPVCEAVQKLWRHSVAASIAARWLARESGEPEPERLAKAGMLHGLGRWAVAAVDPLWFRDWLETTDSRRAEKERRDLGTDLGTLGRRLAERWGCDPLVSDAAWLHDRPLHALKSAAAEPERLALIQEAVQWAERTPWSMLGGAEATDSPPEPRLKILIAEVQSRCTALFTAADATHHEELAMRSNARLRQALIRSQKARETLERFHVAFNKSTTDLSLERWAELTAEAWCSEPEVLRARVAWSGDGVAKECSAAPASDSSGTLHELAPVREKEPDLVLPLGLRGIEQVQLQLWTDSSQSTLKQRLADLSIVKSWELWGSFLRERKTLERRLDLVVAEVKRSFDSEEVRLREAKLRSLAEFAAGAGHELNNPLAVIAGRAQLLLSRCQDPQVVRSLRIILGQAQRTHRMLRDLMFVARPPQPRPRACSPTDVLRACLEEYQAEREARGIRLATELDDETTQAWVDPDQMHHLAGILLRNAIQASAAGALVRVKATNLSDCFEWTFADEGRGVAPHEAEHLFDPFYCGRQAGRGLGLGLPRAARIVELAGGTIKWSSTPRQGSVFSVRIPTMGRLAKVDGSVAISLNSPEIPQPSHR